MEILEQFTKRNKEQIMILLLLFLLWNTFAIFAYNYFLCLELLLVHGWQCRWRPVQKITWTEETSFNVPSLQMWFFVMCQTTIKCNFFENFICRKKLFSVATRLCFFQIFCWQTILVYRSQEKWVKYGIRGTFYYPKSSKKYAVYEQWQSMKR